MEGANEALHANVCREPFRLPPHTRGGVGGGRGECYTGAYFTTGGYLNSAPHPLALKIKVFFLFSTLYPSHVLCGPGT